MLTPTSLANIKEPNPGTILERLNALESHIPRIDKDISRLNERIDELVRLLGA